MVDSTKSFEVSNDGISIEKADGTDGVWFGGGDAVPTHSAVIGSMYLRTNGDWYKQEGPGATDWVIFSGDPGNSYAIKFGSNSNSGTGKWLEIHRNITSNDVPFVVPLARTLKEITATISSSGTVTFGIYKNGSQIDTIVLSAQTKNVKTGLSHSLAANDELSIKVNSGSASDPVLHLIIG